jgi:hypothetical protein
MARKKPGKGPRPVVPRLPPELRAAMLKLRPEPELVAEVLAEIMVQRGKISDFEACAEAYCDFHGIAPREMTSARHIASVGALYWRVIALADVLGHDLLGPEDMDPGRFHAVVEATCTTRLLDGKGPPRFQPLEFLTAVQRIETELRR